MSVLSVVHCAESGARRVCVAARLNDGYPRAWCVYANIEARYSGRRWHKTVQYSRVAIRDSLFVWNSRIGYIRREFACIVFYSCQFGFWLAEQLFRQNQKTRITMHSRPRIAHSLTLDLREIGILAPESFNSSYPSCENICVLNQYKRKKESSYLYYRKLKIIGSLYANVIIDRRNG